MRRTKPTARRITASLQTNDGELGLMGNRDAAVNLHVYKRGVVNEVPKRTAK